MTLRQPQINVLQCPPPDKGVTSRKQPLSSEKKDLALSLFLNLPLLPALLPHCSAPQPPRLSPCWAGRESSSTLHDLQPLFMPRSGCSLFCRHPCSPLVTAGIWNPEGALTGCERTCVMMSRVEWCRISFIRQMSPSLFAPRPLT